MVFVSATAFRYSIFVMLSSVLLVMVYSGIYIYLILAYFPQKTSMMLSIFL